MSSVDAGESDLRERLTAIVCVTPPLMRVLSVACRICLPDWLVFAGAVYQPVLRARPQIIESTFDSNIWDLQRD